MINLSDYRNIHCIGIGGVGVSAIAEILMSRGYKVSGSDMKESEITARLAAKGIKVYIGHARENVEEAELIVYSAAIAEENPEIIRAREKGIPLASRAEVLGVLMNGFENSIAISGTHGKTTTTSMVSLILEHAKLEPTILVGGNLAEIGGNVKVGHGDYFITEACEYRDSFLQLQPKIEVILNIDSDHLDYFKDINHIVNSFERFTKLVPDGGKIIAYDANPYVRQIIENIPGTVTFGYNENCTYSITDVEFDENGMPSFNIVFDGQSLGCIKLKMPGEHNILNATAAFACCHQLGVDTGVMIETLLNFTGTQRRFDVVGTTSNGVKIVDDYAHHPTEIQATLSAASNIPNNRLWCLFQPHTYTRTLALFDEFADSFCDADILVLAKIYAAREKDIYKISSKALAEEILRKHPGKTVYYFDTLEEIAEFVKENAQPEDLVITMGAGDIYKVGEMVIEE